MKKNVIPATIAALAVTLTSVTAPHTFADEASVTANQSAAADLSLQAGESAEFSPEDLLEAIGYDRNEVPQGSIDGYKITSVDGPRAYKFGFASSEAGTQPGVYEIGIEVITSAEGKESLTGTLTVEVTGVALSGNAYVLDATDEEQNTGLKLANQATSPTVVVTDAGGKTIKHDISNSDALTVTPGADAVGPLTVTVTDDSLAASLTKSIPLRVTATVSPKNYVVEADGKRYVSGVSLTQATEATKITAVDEDGNPVEFDVTKGLIYLTTTTDIEGPITLTVTDPTLAGGSKSFTITVWGHEAEVNDNDAEGDDAGDETDAITVSGSAQELVANGESQFTGLTLVNGNEDTTVTAKDKDGATVAWAVATDGKISVTPKADTVSPITITVTDESLEEAVTKEVSVKAPSAEDTPRSSDIGDFGLVALGAVLAAVIGIIGAIGTGLIQLPF